MFKLISFLPELYFFLFSFFLFFFCIIFSLSSILNFPNIYKNALYISIIGLFYTFFLFLNNNIYYFDFSIIYKNQSNVMLSEFFIFITIIILLSTIKYNSFFNITYIEYLIFILISLGSLFIFINLMNLIFIYILLELQSILISILISIKKFNRFSIEASIKYFILGSFSSLLFMFGLSIIYGSTGMLSLHEINLFFDYFETINNDLVLFSINISSIFLLVGLLFKIYSAPFHFWLPDIYEGSPTSVLIYISTIQLIVMVFFFLKIYYYVLFDIIKLKLFIISIISLLTLLFGSMGALLQRKLKKLISFSTVTMNGFFLFTIIHNNIFLLETSLMYLFVYVFTIILLFSLLLNMFLNNNIIICISDFFNIYNYNKYLSHLFTILIFSISGIPPFIGFISKLFWLKSILIEYNIYIFLLVFTFLIVTFYYIRLLKSMYYSFDNNYNTSNLLLTLNYVTCILLMSLQQLLFFFIFNSSFLRYFIKIIVLNFFYLI